MTALDCVATAATELELATPVADVMVRNDAIAACVFGPAQAALEDARAYEDWGELGGLIIDEWGVP